jgi:hypothetical protein
MYQLSKGVLKMTKTIQERIEIIQNLLGLNTIIAKPLKAGTLKNKVFGKSCTGYTFEIDTLSYRGIWASTIEDIELTVDSEKVSKSDMLFCLNGLKIPIDNLSGHTEDFWGAKDTAVVNVNKIGGLDQGDHKFEIIIKKRADFGHSYGEGEQGYENASEFHNPAIIKDEIIYKI